MSMEDVRTKNYVTMCSCLRELLRIGGGVGFLKSMLSQSNNDKVTRELLELALVGAHVMSSMTPVERRDVVMAALLGAKPPQEV